MTDITMNEIEIKFLEVNPDDLEKKLIGLGAEKISDVMLEEWLYAKPEWGAIGGRVRIRKEGEKTTVAYKETTQETSKGNLEIEFGVSNAGAAKQFVDKMDLGIPRHQQKRRVHFTLKNIAIDIDFWPLIPPMVEIEGDNLEELEKLAKQLDLDKAKRSDLDAFQIYKQVYNVAIDEMKELVFET